MTKYFKSLLFTGAISLFVFTSCSHSHHLDPVLKEAQVIQDEAIHMGMQVDSILNQKFLVAKDTSAIKLLNQLKSDVATWRSSMVAIPGSKHKCNHDHGDHVHVVGSDASHLSPTENKKVQEEWKAVIDSINLNLR